MRNNLLVFGGFANDAKCVLAAIQSLAGVLGELLSKALLRSGCPLEQVKRNVEGRTAIGADTSGGYSS